MGTQPLVSPTYVLETPFNLRQTEIPKAEDICSLFVYLLGEKPTITLNLSLTLNLNLSLIPVASRPLGQVGPWPDLKYAKSGQVGPDQDWSGQARFIF